MTAALAQRRVTDRPARLRVERRAEDRWLSGEGQRRRLPATLLMIAFGSLAAHIAVMTGLALTGRPPIPPPPHEIAVEIVQDMPKPPPLARPQPAKLAKPLPPPPKPAAPPSEADALQKELAALKAEQAELKRAAGEKPAGSGPLAGSMQAVALPTIGDDGVAASYQDIVFSQLAKAKGIGQQKGQKGTAGVRFEIDGAGALVNATVVAPSGVAALDAEALDIVRRAAPFPAPPKDAQRQFVANVNFVPQDGM